MEVVEVQWPSQSERMAAVSFLHGSAYSKPPQQVEITPVAPPPMIDYSKLSDAELDQLEQLHAKAAAKQLESGGD